MRKKIVPLKVFLIQASSVLAFTGVVLTFDRVLLACTESLSTPIPSMSSQYPQQSRVALKNSSWQLARWERQGSPVALVPQTELSLQFEDNRVTGSSGCNRFSGSFNLAKDKLSLKTLEATQRGCEPGVMNQESQFLSALQSVNRVASEAPENLVLFYTNGTEKGALYFTPRK